MVLAVIVLAVLVIVCMIVAMSLSSKGETKLAYVSMITGLIFLMFVAGFALTPSFRLYVKTNIFQKSGYEYIYNTASESLPLPEASASETVIGTGANVFVTKATTKQIESFYESIAEQDTFVSIRTDGAHRISLKYNGKYFLIKVSTYENDYRKLEIEISE